MSGHSEDPVQEESKRFFTFFNLSMLLVAITGIEIVIIYVRSFEGLTIITILSACSVIKFIGVMTWFMHLRWDKILNTVLFLMGLVIAAFTYFAVIYMADETPVVEKFAVSPLEQEWKSDSDYKSGDFVKVDENFYISEIDHKSPENFESPISMGDKMVSAWKKVKGIPHQITWKVSTGDLIEINSLKPENPFFHLYHPTETENIEGAKISLLSQNVSAEDFRIKVRSEAFWVDGLNQ
ncbi:MAG: cytochrome C oxidase subunit IV family protein [Opitutae bacterium]|jgi:cytochrome c oxidase subunit IV|nr:cytochrome C oxidase subunit IV family protein [Opitutae bacterium]MBT5716036.1 cytochrome C oxidase subunit IV family protein [Opitutae bacterium]